MTGFTNTVDSLAIKKEYDLDVPDGLITYEGILRGIRNFGAKIEDLKVRDVMDEAPIFGIEDDLFDIWERLQKTGPAAYEIIDGQQRLACLSMLFSSVRALFKPT